MTRWMVVAVVWLGACVPVAVAQDEAMPAAISDPEPATAEATSAGSAPASPITLSIRGGAIYAFRADLKDADSSVARFLASGGIDMGWVASDTLRLGFGATYEYANYDFDDAEDFIPGLGDDPFDDFNTVGFSVSGTHNFNPQWFLTLGGFASAGWESGASVADAWTGGGYATVGLNVSDTLVVGVGLGASSQLEAEPIVFPAIFVRWTINDSLRLESERLGGRFVYSPTDTLDVYLRANWERREYRLADDHAKIDDGILRDTTVPVGIGIGWRPIRGLTVGIEGGALVYSKLKFRNDLGNTVFDSELDTGPYVRFTVEYSF